MADLIGHSLGRYHILEQLGEGGMAVVYKAYDTRLEAEVAVKVIRTENILPSALDRMLKRFEREAKALARLTHPNIVKVTDYGEYEGRPYLVMPYLPGGTLKEWMSGKPIPWQEAARILIPVADALGYAHKHDIIHRDVKPSNILITENGQPMLADFGVAKLLEAGETMELTGTGVGLGTPEYMAPEQVTNKLVDARADIYALGVVLYEMVTGRKPFIADTPMAVLIMHSRDPLPRPKSFVSSLPDRVEQVLFKALAKKPEDRYQDMGEMVKAFEKLQRDGGRQSVIATKPKEEKGTSKPTSESKLPVRSKIAMIIFGLVALVLLVVFSLPSLVGKPGLTPAATSTDSLKNFTPIPATEILTLVPTSTPSEVVKLGESTGEALPSGSQIITVGTDSDMELVRVAPDGTQTMLTNNNAFDGHVAVSPDGRRVAFWSARDGGLDIYVMNIDGTNVVRVTNDGGSYDPSWMPDDNGLFYVSSQPGGSSLKLLDITSGETTTIALFPYRISCPELTSDKNQMLFIRQPEIGPWWTGKMYIMSIGGGEPVLQTESMSVITQGTFPWSSFLQSPDHYLNNH